MTRYSFSILIAFAISLPLPLFADNAPPIRLGALFSLSSWGAQGGQAELNGAVLAIEDINARGGVLGRRLELVIEDTQSDLKTTAAAFRKLTSVDRVPAIIGPNWAEFVGVIAPLAASEKVPVVTPSGYEARQLRTDPWVFVLWPPPSVNTTLLAEAMAQRKVKRVSALVSENAYYQNLLSALRPQLKSRGILVVDEFSFAPGSADLRSAIGRLSRNGSEAAIVFLLNSGEFAAFLRQRREHKLPLPLFGANTLPFDSVVLKDLTLANGLTYFDHVGAETEGFRERYQKRFHEPVGQASAKAYDGMILIAQAIKECGTERPAIRKCLQKADFTGVSGKVQFDEKGVLADTMPNAKLMTVSDGRISEYSE